MFCGYCGKQTDAGMKFCPYCGKPMQEETVVVIKTEENVTTSEATKSDKAEEARSAFIELLKGLKKAKKLIIAAVVVLVVIIAGVSIVKSQNSVVGTWEYSYGFSDEVKTTERKGALYFYDYIEEITFYSDGTIRVKNFSSSHSFSGSYEIINDGERIEICCEEGYTSKTREYDIDRKGNELIFTNSYNDNMYYKKTK